MTHHRVIDGYLEVTTELNSTGNFPDGVIISWLSLTMERLIGETDDIP